MGTRRPDTVSPKLQRIAELARRRRGDALTTLAHHIDLDFLREARRRTRHDGAPGVDGQRAVEFDRDLERNLQQLLEAFRTGHWRAPPVRRAYIPKDDGRKRPIGIPTMSDKILQRAVTMVLEAVYEQEFYDFSYGFRPGRSAHQALQSLYGHLTSMGGGWVIDADIEGFFDTLDHGHLRAFLDQRVRDGVLRRAIGKWLKAGVMENGCVSSSDIGTPQGGVISPLLANVYLHHVLDRWFVEEVRPRLTGRGQVVRFADDFVIVLEHEADARRVMEVLPKRLARFGLRLHPTKTRLLDFRSPGRRGPDGPRPPTFDFLGFTHHWAKSRRGRDIVARKTAKGRFSRTLRRIAIWCRTNRHLPIATQHISLTRQLRGHDAYYGITGNYRALDRLRRLVTRIWHKWLTRRGGRHRLNWAAFNQLLRRFPLPRARVVHSVYRRAANPTF